MFVSRLSGFQKRGIRTSASDPVLLQQLAQAHGFRLEALGANRAGLLSAAQANDLARRTRRAGLLIAAFGMASLCGSGLWLLSSPGHLLPGLLGIALGLVLSLLGLLDLVRGRSAGRQVAFVESFLRVRWVSREDPFPPRPPGYYYETDAGLSFSVFERATRLIDPGQRYRLYYTVEGQELVNLEPVGSTFAGVPPSGGSALATPFSGSPYHLSAAEVSAILGVPVTPEELNARPDPGVPGMTMVSFANLAAGIRATYGFRLGGRALKHSQLWEALIRRRGEREPSLGDEAYLVPNGFVYVYCGDVLLMATVRVFQPGQMVTDRKLTLALAQALLQQLGR